MLGRRWKDNCKYGGFKSKGSFANICLEALPTNSASRCPNSLLRDVNKRRIQQSLRYLETAFISILIIAVTLKV